MYTVVAPPAVNEMELPFVISDEKAESEYRFTVAALLCFTISETETEAAEFATEMLAVFGAELVPASPPAVMVCPSMLVKPASLLAVTIGSPIVNSLKYAQFPCGKA